MRLDLKPLPWRSIELAFARLCIAGHLDRAAAALETQAPDTIWLRKWTSCACRSSARAIDLGEQQLALMPYCFPEND